MLPHILDEIKMLDTNLISSCTTTFVEAVEIAEQLAVTIATSPSDGVANTLRLLRPGVLSEQKLAKVCVSYVKALHTKKSHTELPPQLKNIQ